MILGRWKSSVFALMLALVFLSGVASAEEVVPLKERIAKMLNLGTEVTVEKYYNGNDLIAVWTEQGENGTALNWGIVSFLNGQPVDSWFYTGKYTNRFIKFHSFFRHIMGDGRREFVIAAEGHDGGGWVNYFVFNLEDKKVKMVYQGESMIRGSGNLTVTGQHYFPEAGIFADLNKDGADEILSYSELRGESPWAVYWVDIYGWDGKNITLLNKKYPEFYKPLLSTLEMVAKEEERLPMGKYRIFYEHMAKIYELWNQPKEAQVAREQMNLPPLGMGAKMRDVLYAKGYKVSQLMRIDLDGHAPLDALVWGKNKEGTGDIIWLTVQQAETASDPFILPLSEAFFKNTGETTFAFQDGRIWAYRQSEVGNKFTGLGYLYRYDGANKVTLLGIEERSVENGQVSRKIMGEEYRDLELLDKKVTTTQVALLQTTPAQSQISVDGLFMETEWTHSNVTMISQSHQVIQGKDSWQGRTDLSYSVQALTQGNKVYLGLKVVDDSRIYAQVQGLEQSLASDHIEICLIEKEKLHRYGIFIMPTQTQVVEWVDGGVQLPTHTIRAQWMPSADGYWLEIELGGLSLTKDIYPLTILVSDTDDASAPAVDSLLATSTYRANEGSTLGALRLR